MSVIISQVSNTQTFGTWLARTNQIAETISANVVTTDNTVIGGFTSGNGTVIGHFGSNTLFAIDEFRGGNVSTSNTLSVISNTVFKYETDNLVSITSDSINSNVTINVTTVDVSVSDMNVDADYLNVNTFYEVNINTVSFTANATSTTLNSVNTSINGSNLVINTTNTMINSNTVISNRLNVSNAVSFANTLNVTGATTLSNTLNVTGATTLSNTLSVAGAANVLSTFGMRGAANALSTFGMGGAANALSTFGVNGVVTFANTLNVTGASSLSNTLAVTGATTLSNTLAVTGATTLSNTLNVTRATTLSNTLSVTGATTLSDKLSVVNATSLSNTLSVAGAANVLSTFGVGGNANVAGSLGVTGDLTIEGSLTYNGVAKASVIPNQHLTYDLGNTTFYWLNSFIGRGIFSNGFSVTDGSSNTVFNTDLLFIDTTNNRVGIGNTAPGQKLVVSGTIESTTGGIKFPDGNIQTKALQANGTTTGYIQYSTSGYLDSSAGFTFAVASNTVTVGNNVNMRNMTFSNASSNVAYSTTTTFVFTSTAVVQIDSFSAATYRSAEMLIQFSDSASPAKYQVSKILIIHNGTDSYITEYGVISTTPGVPMGTLTTSIQGGNVIINCAAATATTTVKTFRTKITV